jgi:hypothetical protein
MYYVFGWDYPKDIASDKQKRLRHLMHKQILLSDIILKKTKTKNKCDVKYLFAQDYKETSFDVYLSESDDNDSIDISEYH